MPEGYTKIFAEKLNELSNLTVIETQGDEIVQPGFVYLAKAGKHLLVEKDLTVIFILNLISNQ